MLAQDIKERTRLRQSAQGCNPLTVQQEQESSFDPSQVYIHECTLGDGPVILDDHAADDLIDGTVRWTNDNPLGEPAYMRGQVAIDGQTMPIQVDTASDEFVRQVDQQTYEMLLGGDSQTRWVFYSVQVGDLPVGEEMAVEANVLTKERMTVPEWRG